MANRSVNTGAAGRLTQDLYVIGVEPWNNRSLLRATLTLAERTSSPTTWSGGGIAASMTTPSMGLWSGTFGFDWRPGGLQSQTIAQVDFWQVHNPDGSGAAIVAGSIANTGTSGAGGPTTVDVGITLDTFVLVPNTPTGLVATRVSDTQVDLSWAQSSPANAQPTSNKIQRRLNDGAWEDLLTISPSTAATVGAAENQKLEFRVAAANSAGQTAWSASSAAVYTTPGAPTGAVAAKNSSSDIVVTFTPNVAYIEHTHEVWHGTVTGGVTTWDGAPLATLAAGVASYTHVAPSSSAVHIYRVRSKAGALTSAYAVTNSVLILAPPNAPTIPAMPAFVDKASVLTFSWVHNPVDTTPQTAYEFAYSTNGGSTWTTTGKVVSGASSATRPANTYAANTALTMRVRTWGSATTGGSEGTGASPWSDLKTVTFKTVPTVSITSPATGGTVTDSTLRVTLAFAQAEAATFVNAQLELVQAGVTVEALESTNLVGITFGTTLQNGLSYTVRARVQDSNGLWSSWATSTFSVTYLAPVPAAVTLTFLPDTGFGQVDLAIPAPGAGEATATTVTITRAIGGVVETVVQDYPVAASLTFLDTTPTVHGTNTYTVTTKSALGAQTVVTVDLVTTECRRAYLAKGASFQNVVVFGGNLSVDVDASVASDTVQAAGRLKPIGLYGVETAVQLKVKSFVFEGFGSTFAQLEAMLLTPGKACFRDASGRRVFGSVEGGLSYSKSTRGDFSFTLTETS